MNRELVLNVLLAIQTILAALFAWLLFRIAYVMVSFKNPLPFVPTGYKVAKTMAKLANLKLGDKAIDLGSGEGHLLIALNKAYPDNELVGVEKSKYLNIVAKLRVKIWGRKPQNIKILRQDIFQTDLAPYNIIVCFLTTKVFEELAPNFNNLKPGTRVITHMFGIPGCQPSETHLVVRTKIFVYQF